MKKDPVISLVKWYVIGLLIIIIGAMLCSSCTLLKKSSRVNKDSTAVAKVDSGNVKINSTEKKDSLAWWREIVNFGRDTTINNITTPINNYYPTSYIREGGVRTVVEKSINYDSLWLNKMDSLAVKLSKTDKSKETKVLGFWQILAIAAGVGLVFFVLGKVKIGMK